MKLIAHTTILSASFALIMGGGLRPAVAEISAEDVLQEEAPVSDVIEISLEGDGANVDNAQRFIPQGPEAGTELFPPNPRPGGCYARVLSPAQYKTETIQMLKREASQRLEILPAKFKTVEETIVVKEASEKLVIVPATYEWTEEKVMVKPAFQKLEAVPAQFDVVSEQVIDKPAHVVWERGRGLIEKVNFATGEIVCLKEIPATYKTVTKRILKNPATTRTIEVPAEYKIVKKRLMKTPPIAKPVEIPEETTVQNVLQKVEPATVKRTPIPEEFQTFTKRIRVSEEKMAWKPVLCETNTTPQVLRQLQHSLKEKGFNPGPIDGTIGASTMKAILAFQKDQGLSIGGLTMDTFRALKVKLPWLSESKMINTGGELRQ